MRGLGVMLFAKNRRYFLNPTASLIDEDAYLPELIRLFQGSTK